MKAIYIITGGSMVHVTPHFALCAPAYGQVGVEIYNRLSAHVTVQPNCADYQIHLIKTRMAGPNAPTTIEHLTGLGISPSPESNHDLKVLVNRLVQEPETAALIVAAAICDFEPVELTAVTSDRFVNMTQFGKDQARLHHVKSLMLELRPSEKVIDNVKQNRSDLRLVTFKTTAGLNEDELFAQASYNLERSQSDLVFANDIQHHLNLVVTPEGERLCGPDRQATLDLLCIRFWEHIHANNLC